MGFESIHECAGQNLTNKDSGSYQSLRNKQSNPDVLQSGDKISSLRNYMQKYRGFIEPSSGVDGELTKNVSSLGMQENTASPDFSQILD